MLRYSQSPWKHGIETGVSATHLDWTMVPYVRKSFWKHYNDGLKYCENTDEDLYAIKEYQGDFTDNKDLSIQNCVIGNCDIGKKYPKAYEYAMEMTQRELDQAVEGMYHNLKELGRLNSNIKNIAA